MRCYRCVIDILYTTFIGSKCDSYFAKLYNLGVSVSLPSLGSLYLWLLFPSCCVFTVSIFWNKHIMLYGSLAVIIVSIVIVVLTWWWTYKLVARHQRAIQTTQTPSTIQNISRRKILRSTITAFVITADLLVCYSLGLVLFFFEKF